MPCCGRVNSTTRYCFGCVRQVCERACAGVGACPSCRNTVKVDGHKIVLAPMPLYFVRNQLKCECCAKNYNDWQVAHSEWEKVPRRQRDKNMCRDCYGKATEHAFAISVLLALLPPSVVKQIFFSKREQPTFSKQLWAVLIVLPILAAMLATVVARGQQLSFAALTVGSAAPVMIEAYA